MLLRDMSAVPVFKNIACIFSTCNVLKVKPNTYITQTNMSAIALFTRIYNLVFLIIENAAETKIINK